MGNKNGLITLLFIIFLGIPYLAYCFILGLVKGAKWN